ncbi:MAG: 3-dehydroquinate dehydratase [Rickettsiales bacterium]|jgi:3-dehydroquinate dehydratase-2|nr:3-dehydroquinate dehydratase [Rickettsiales bacterium]
MRVLIINGPNMQRLSKRGNQYNASYEQLRDCIIDHAKSKNIEVEFFVTDIEGEIVQAIGRYDGDAIVINAAGYSHYSVAIRDALESFKGKKVEVHMTNVYAREEFRHHSIIAPVCDGVICGFGLKSYLLAMDAAL